MLLDASAIATPSHSPTIRLPSRSLLRAPSTLLLPASWQQERRERSVVKLRRQLLAVALGLVVVDPELRLVLAERVGDLLHRGRALLLVGVHAGHAAVVPIIPKVNGIAGQHHRAGLRQLHQQRLVSR